MKKTTSKKIKDKANNFSKDLKVLDVTVVSKFVNERIQVNVFNELSLKNPENPAEVVEKFNKIAPFYWWLGNAKVEMEYVVASLKDEFDSWLQDRMSVFDGDKDYNSEKSKERQVMVSNKHSKLYKEKKQELRMKEYILRQIDVARKAYDKAASILQSIGAMIREDKNTPDDWDLPNKKNKKHKRVDEF